MRPSQQFLSSSAMHGWTTCLGKIAEVMKALLYKGDSLVIERSLHEADGIVVLRQSDNVLGCNAAISG